MCGIYGFSRRTPTTVRMIPLLSAAMEMRGDDSWGVTDGVQIFKYPSSILQTFEDHVLDTPTYHTRGASVGTISTRNAHPFEYISHEHKRVVVGVHNGHVTNADELRTRYWAQRKEFEVDSENIFAQLAEGLPTKDVRGWGAVVWYEYAIGQPKTRRRFISCFNNAAMHIVKLSSGEIVFASTIESIRIAARFAGATITGMFKVVDKMKYEVMPAGELRSHGLMEWDAPPPFVNRQSSSANSNDSSSTSDLVRDFHSGRGNYSHYGAGASICKSRSCHKICGEEEVLCSACIQKLMQDYFDFSSSEDADAGTAEIIVVPATTNKHIHQIDMAEAVRSPSTTPVLYVPPTKIWCGS